jgi:hypothetical protein
MTKPYKKERDDVTIEKWKKQNVYYISQIMPLSLARYKQYINEVHAKEMSNEKALL